jgi:F420-non-reducing hydrogenase iron-sulfur subunit
VKGRIVALACENSGWKALASLADDPVMDGVETVRLPCSGKAETGMMLKLLEKGAAGVLILGCPKDDCTFLRGSGRAEKRAAVARAALKDAGVGEERVRMEFISSVDAPRLAEAVNAMKKAIEAREVKT